MPKLISKPPKYRKHKPSGQAVVTLDGHDFYLGPHGSKASHLEYDRLIGEWLENGRRLPGASKSDLTITELAAAGSPNGSSTATLRASLPTAPSRRIRPALSTLRRAISGSSRRGSP